MLNLPKQFYENSLIIGMLQYCLENQISWRTICNSTLIGHKEQDLSKLASKYSETLNKDSIRELFE